MNRIGRALGLVQMLLAWNNRDSCAPFRLADKYEVESGQLVLKSKNFVPVAAEDVAEQGVMKELQTTYGKVHLRRSARGSPVSSFTYTQSLPPQTIHTWRPELHPDLPLGPPSLMMSFTGDDQVEPSVLDTRDRIEGQSTAHKRELRAQYLDTGYEPAEGCDAWAKDGKGVVFEPKEVEVAMPEAGGEPARWKGSIPFEEVLAGQSAK